jgi:predicted nucleic acid-binding protein
MKLCFDTNVVLDILGKREDFFTSYCAYDISNLNGDSHHIPMFTTSDVFYLLRKALGDTDRARKALQTTLELFEVFDGHPLDCQSALSSSMSDYEDALLAYAAKRNDIDFIITRNKRDFRKSPVPALTPKEFVELYKPDTVDYQMLELPES